MQTTVYIAWLITGTIVAAFTHSLAANHAVTKKLNKGIVTSEKE